MEKERAEQAKGPAHRAHELDELAKIYEDRGVSPGLARLVRRRPRPRRGPASPAPAASRARSPGRLPLLCSVHLSSSSAGAVGLRAAALLASAQAVHERTGQVRPWRQSMAGGAAGLGGGCPVPARHLGSTPSPHGILSCPLSKRQQYGSGGRLRWQVAEELTAKDVIKAHARDELGIDIDELSKPLQARRPRSRAVSELTGLPGSVRFLHVWAQAGTLERGAQAAGASAAAFCVGAAVPLLAAAFIHDYVWRLVSLVRARPGLWSCAPRRMDIDVSRVYRGWQYMPWDYAGPLAVDHSADAVASLQSSGYAVGFGIGKVTEHAPGR